MRLAIVTHNVILEDGQGRVQYELVRHALRAGVEVRLVADRVDPGLLAEGAAWLPVRPRWRRPTMAKVWEFARAADRVLATEAGEVDVIHACGYVLTVPHHVNAAHFVHGAWKTSPHLRHAPRRGMRDAYQALYTRANAVWERRAFDRCKIVVAVSERVRQDLVDCGVPEGRIRVIPNGVDLDRFDPARPFRPRAQLGLPADIFLALFVGDIRSPIKNLDTLLRASRSVPGMHVAVAGDACGSPYPDLAQSLGVAERVHFLGFRPDVPELMHAADVFVLVSRYESSSLVLLEAMASGLPVVTARTVGAAERVSAGCGIVLEDPEREDELAAALQALRDDAARRASMGQAARQAVAQWSWGRMAAAYLRLYEEAACA